MRKLFALIKKLLKNETVRYLLVGGSNTVLGWVLGFLFTHLLHMGFWASSAVSMVIGSAYSYLLNRAFTFRAGDIPHKKALPRFVLNIAVCYFLSYVPAKAVFDILFAKMNLPFAEDTVTFLKLLGANICFIVLNYLGQKFFAFRKTKQK